jgi:hypothetical protein
VDDARQPDKEPTQASLGAAATPNPAENGSQEAESALPPSGRDDGVAARTRQQQRLRHADGGRRNISILPPASLDALSVFLHN